MWTIELVVIAVMILFNGVFAGYEIALASMAKGRLQGLVDDGRPGAAAALRMKQNIEASLAVVQLGITLVGVIAAATGGAGAEEVLEPVFRELGLSRGVARVAAIASVAAPLTFITIVFGELIPKVFSIRNTEWVCLRLSPVMEWFAYSVWPAVWLLETSVEWFMQIVRRPWGSAGRAAREPVEMQELHGAAAAARMARLIGQREEGIIVSASRLSATPLKQIMLPAEYIGMLAADQTLSEALITAHQEMHTRLPVTEEAGNPQRIIGYVNFKDIIAALRVAPREASLRSLIRRLPSYHEDTSVAHCLEQIMKERNHIALVHQTGGRIVGMITLEDIVEELVGEIHDEFDRMPSFLAPLGDGWIAGGFVSLQQLREETGIEFAPASEKPVYTLNDWIVERLGRPPRGGDVVHADDCQVIVRKTRHILVQEAFILKKDPAEEAPADE